jgi:chemotaxis protein methyltransferase CheR
VEISASSRRILASLLESRTGQQLGSGRRWRVDAALAPLMRDSGFDSVDQLVARLASGAAPALTEQVIEALLNNETYFYRDRLPFDLLLGGPLKRLETARAAEKKISIWSVGCSTGQELYSIAMSLAEQELRWRGWTIELVGTDISRAAIQRAREGRYSQFEVQRGLPVIQMLRWFNEEGNGQWQVAERLRNMVRFEVRTISERPPRPGKFDIILCRNLLLYFADSMRRLAFTRLADSIAPDGSLMLGAGETVIGQTDQFVSDPTCRGLYIPAPAMATPARRVA